MNPLAKLAGFAVVLALVFAGAAFAGSRLDVHPGRPAADKPAHMGGMAAATMPVRGLAVSDHGLTLQLARRTAQPGRRFELAFRIADRRGQTVRDFDVEHTKRMHFIVVRRDMTGFQHLHPTQRAGRQLVGPGHAARRGLLPRVRRLLGRRQAVHARRRPHRRRLGALAGAAGAGRQRRGRRRSRLARRGRRRRWPSPSRATARPSPSRTTWAPRATSSRCARAISPSCTCTPTTNRLRFEATFPTPGRYRLFLQFKTADGRLHTAAFTREVTR